MKIALLQTTTPGSPDQALAHLTPLFETAVAKGAQLILTPECSNLMEQRKDRKAEVVTTLENDACVQGVQALVKRYRVPTLLGSAIVKSPNEGEERAVNRTLYFDGNGEIAAHYDKIHLFDATTPNGEVYRESASVKGGDRAVVAQTPFGGLGLTICYDVRFGYLHRALAQAGAAMIAVPAAFTVPTGQAHWEVMLRARAIETGAFILAPAQGGQHEDGRKTWGHSMVVNPWGEVIAHLNHDHPAVLIADIDLAEVARARAAIPQLQHDRTFVRV
ncbi:carbon-nitrogen hydrolase family protein [Asticcacaulis sp. YBE204]|uniref:carbon-nitrogen hydrolase family protein n=1 Tax=Asticcacaulis sp. YBE204 TaxID=1282363 RepID=UPI0003C3F7C5|nr:carbon-nitrogen hydrolase family protein [Asticcacaulis sp. YBE204]ESQ81320.1 amidohydrolase [Asticcacaulis sp. YBE204]